LNIFYTSTKPYVSVTGYNSQSLQDTFTGILTVGAATTDQSVMNQFDDYAEKQQTKDIFTRVDVPPGMTPPMLNTAYPCNPANSIVNVLTSTALKMAKQSDCQPAADFLASLIDEFPANVYTPAEVTAMKNAISQSFLFQQGGNGDGTYLNNWRCGPSQVTMAFGQPENTCQLFIPIKRLNVYPDELELVWFDGREVDNAAYAIWAITQYTPNFSTLVPGVKMCTYSAPQSGTGTTVRPFAFDEVDHDVINQPCSGGSAL
jgi:hypothetical protein